MSELVTTADLAKFESGDQQFFLDAAEATVRAWCGWHIAPSRREEELPCTVGQLGTILLPSLHVTDVETVTVEDLTLDPADYDWDPAGFIHRNTVSWPRRYYWPVYGYPSRRNAKVTFTHGYPEVPDDVKTVILELASKAIELPTSIASEVDGGPFKIKLRGDVGTALTESQRSRLVNYQIKGIG
ncbi:Uncharacterised protein [Mycobacteroides abscessus subsp. massiliense]|uniref:hypothetical protein n=1 Tax=Mycobacteroides abscessus TaxID=36809 RepID=UPI0009A6CD4A|nr:hypothetical protein [Mycobacteroides abscessus]SKM81074.1 Uncharacterised protein [Mycobacteroides abscessus subsp. massiliense]SKM97517.1 Uncharacterised protein [Mycobacteroides abscessus subsp. massiliense]SKN76413.1 Uncharacterised protein [Mycobacteroides abscessus subsp. massiliense]SKN96731.1 Uncharacterised protein [Mycobacteroides abscessus subsp. massiliense]SKO21082.1 Uncharacterised protein [Mycobacteroides abscessus subsp. massiliense]